ncbi:peptidoglycan-binding protein [bacterium]|nr:peptidoglycan-binding protein [bacterium]
MKKVIFLIIISVIILSGYQVASVQALGIGSRGEEVKAIQEILKEDPTVYPEGLVTGYFGRLTNKALQRVQKKFGIYPTGVLDSETEKVLFPPITSVEVISPNGGENWDRNQIQTIKWSVNIPTPLQNQIYKRIRWIWPKVSIDLFRRPAESTSISNSVFVKHIAFVPYWKNSYSWRIPNSVPNGSDYVIRVTMVKRPMLPCFSSHKNELEECVRQKLALISQWDESDSPFTISGEISPSLIPGLSEIIEALERISAELNNVIEKLREIAEG